MPYLQDDLGEVSPPSGVPTGERGGRLHQKEADLPLAASPLEGAGPLVRGEVGVCRVLRCWVHYLQPRNLPQDDRLTRSLYLPFIASALKVMHCAYDCTHSEML